jgi:hypothetical protein
MHLEVSERQISTADVFNRSRRIQKHVQFNRAHQRVICLSSVRVPTWQALKPTPFIGDRCQLSASISPPKVTRISCTTGLTTNGWMCASFANVVVNAEGRKMFKEALLDGRMEGYFSLAAQFQTRTFEGSLGRQATINVTP